MKTPIKTGNLIHKFDLIADHWNPRIIAELNGQYVKIAKIKGSFVWHSHAEEDELFYVVKGSMQINLKDQELQLQMGDFVVIPRGVLHCPVATEEAWILLFEPKSTRNTGAVDSELTRNQLEEI